MIRKRLQETDSPIASKLASLIRMTTTIDSPTASELASLIRVAMAIVHVISVFRIASVHNMYDTRRHGKSVDKRAHNPN